MKDVMETIKKLLVEHVRQIVDENQIDVESDLRGYGLDSMSATNLMVDIEDEYDIHFTDQMLTPETFYSVKTLATAVNQLLVVEA